MQRLQFFLSESTWDNHQVNARHLELLLADPATAPHASGVLVVDDSGDRKAGTATAHVGKQRSWPPPLHALCAFGHRSATGGPQRRFRAGPSLRHKAKGKEKPQVTASESWGFSEPPSGFEPETYALRVST
ncbi:transposase [Streptomyces sp. NPDC048479]|uniref:transposase n=1 Tax=Streptomyces sp. NPDC048479 TaxID=3154725 RepID=UPI0034323D2B